ncbi:hypothetical protein [Chryseobacterium sp. HR92]|uniref:hypothetical protein n=1 Tax=Chryseobacterium sp. HR92 TaxID=3094839 RepID=UPI00389107BC|nr:hypothetical protein SFA27_16765 [Chryseobacterium sp. HR92]
MEANEMRIGNFVFDKGGNIEIVHEVSKYGDLYRINERDPDYFSPIPLTEEWLNKFGFQLDQYVEIESLIDEVDGREMYLELEYGERGAVICISADDPDESMNIRLKYVKYVHQLQNLFFALKGKELILK